MCDALFLEKFCTLNGEDAGGILFFSRSPTPPSRGGGGRREEGGKKKGGVRNILNILKFVVVEICVERDRCM